MLPDSDNTASDKLGAIHISNTLVPLENVCGILNDSRSIQRY